MATEGSDESGAAGGRGPSRSRSNQADGAAERGHAHDPWPGCLPRGGAPGGSAARCGGGDNVAELPSAAAQTEHLHPSPSSASLPPPRLPPSRARPPTPRSTPSASLRATPPPITSASSPRLSPVPRRPALEPAPTLHPPASPSSSQDPARGLDEDKKASQHAATNPGGHDSLHFKHQEAEMQSSREKRKVPNVKRAKAPDAKRFKSPLAPMAVKSPGVRLMLSPKLGSPSVTPARSLSPAQKSPSQGSSHRKRKLRSRIWTEFEPIYDGQTIVQAKCTHCHKLFKANRDFGTSGCIRHLKSCEGRARLDNMLTQMSADNLSSHDDSLRNWKFDQEKCEQELVKLIVVHELPFSLVGYSKFRSFVSTLNPWFKHLSRTTIKKYCLTTYEEGKIDLRNTIERLNCRFSLTADLWTSNQNLGYLCVTLHFIDASWLIHKRIIKFISVETPHDGSNLFNAMLKTIQDWNIEDKVFSITLDNATSNDSFVNSLQENLVAKCLLSCEGKFLHYRCAAHVLNLIAQEGLKAMSGTIGNIRESVKYIRSSPARKERFEKIVHRVGISYTQRPTLDIATRWNSTYEMLKSAAGYKRAFKVLAIEDSQYLYQPADEEWDMANKLCSMLRVFSEATQVLSGSRYPTIHLYFHQLWEVKKMLEKESSSSEPLIVTMVHEMKKKFKKYWELSFLNICIPVILDPRFKLGFLEFRLKKGFGNMAATYFSKIDQSFCDLFEEYSLQFADFVSKNAHSDNKDVINVDEDDPWADWGQVQNQQQVKTTNELEDYLSEETVPIGGSFDILEHWKVYSTKYPTLAHMARDILAIPASTVASESAFSTGERVISDYRSRLSSDTVEALICLQDWVRTQDSKEDNIAGNIIEDAGDDDS